MVRLLVRVLGPEERGAGRPRRGHARGGPPPPARRGAEVRLRAVEPHRRGGSARRSGLRRPDLRDAAPAPRERLEAVAAVARRLVHHLSRLIEPDGREWKDYLALLDAFEALKHPPGRTTAPPN